MNHNKKVTIGVILFKGEKYLKESLGSLINQDYPNLEILLRDQSPNAEAYHHIKTELPEIARKVKLEKGGNLWHSGGHNTLIRQMTPPEDGQAGEYYICASNDMLYPADFISKMVREMEKPENKKYGSATPKLMRWDFANRKQTTQIDSCGIGIKASHHFYDVGQGEEDTGKYDKKKEIFGPSGALGMYRKEALEAIAYENDKGQKEYFDELIHYKNDVDLAYRLQWADYPSLFIPTVKVYHDRQVSNLNKSPSLLVRIVKGRKGKNKWARESSFFGQQVVLMKNYSKKFSLKTKLKIARHQWLSLGYITIFEPYLYRQLRELKGREKEIAKKTEAMKRTADPKQIEKLMK